MIPVAIVSVLQRVQRPGVRVIARVRGHVLRSISVSGLDLVRDYDAVVALRARGFATSTGAGGLNTFAWWKPAAN